MIAIAALLSLTPSPDVLTVNSAGGADFTHIAPAVDAASDGDILIVEEGFYTNAAPSLSIDKALRILGRAGGLRPILLFDLVLVPSDKPVTLAGLHLQRLTVSGVKARVRVDECVTGEFAVDASDEVLATRTVNLAFGPDCRNGLSVGGDARVAFVNGFLRGGAGDEFCASLNGSDGVALDVPFDERPSTILLAGTDVRGGDGAPELVEGGSGGSGVRADAAAPSAVDVRGSSSHSVGAGLGFDGGLDGAALDGTVITFSGIATDGAIVGASSVAPAEPYLIIEGASGLGALREIQLFGPSGQPALAFASLQALDPLAIPGWDAGELWLDPTGIAIVWGVALAGQDSPAAIAVPVPSNPAFGGLEVDVQGLALMPDGSLHLTNPSQIIPRF